MTNRNLKVVYAGFALALAVAACDNSNLTNLNHDPNNPTDVAPGPLFTNATRNAVGRFLGAGFNLRGTEFMAQHLAEVQYPDEDRFTRLTGGSTTGYFDAAYTTELQDYQVIIRKGIAMDSAGYWAPAMAMQTWTFSYITDTWGDIPYSQALKGDSGTIAPAYDPQQEIYASFFRRLDSVSVGLEGADNTLGNADAIYGGDPGSWQVFANSLRARMAMRIVNVDEATARTQLQAAISAPGGLMTSNAENAELGWPGDGIYDNPWAANFTTRDDHRVSDRLFSVLDSLSDPRLPVFAQPLPGTTNTYAGQPNGLTASAAAAYLNTASRPGAIFYPGPTTYGVFGGSGKTYPSRLMTYAEVEFILAEALERGWTLTGVTGTAATHYAAGITASMQQWGVPAGQIATYLASGPVAYAGGAAGLRQIAYQKWIHLYTDGTQAWAEWRRTCAPSNIHAGPSAIRTFMPRRFQYSVTEKSVNNTNLQAAIDDQGPDVFETRVWWDTNPTVAPTYTLVGANAATICAGTLP